MSIIDHTHYDAVRAALSLEVDDTIVTDDMISLSIYQGTAEAEILRRDPLALSRTGSDADHIVNATIYMTAAMIAPAMSQLKRESFGDYSYAVNMDWGKRAKELRTMADREIAAILDAENTATHSMPTMFAVASARRGR